MTIVWAVGMGAGDVADWASKLAGWASKLAGWASKLAGWASKLADWADWPADSSSITIRSSAASSGEAIEGATDESWKGNAAGERREAVCSGTIGAAGVDAIAAAGGLSGGERICRTRLGILWANK